MFGAIVASAAVIVGLWAFEPWRLFTSSEVNEAAPSSSRVLDSAEFEDAEHDTNGRVEILELADGRRFVRLEELASSDGPDLQVWITDQPSGGEWGSYDDGRYVKLGELKATHGNQNYEIPEDADLDGLKSVVIWCDRFNVAFGTAPVTL